jgi:hypothetical protein
MTAQEETSLAKKGAVPSVLAKQNGRIFRWNNCEMRVRSVASDHGHQYLTVHPEPH